MIFGICSLIILALSSYEDIKTREISHWKWFLIFILAVGSLALDTRFNPHSTSAYYTGKYALATQIGKADIQSMFIYFGAVLFIFFVGILFFKGIGGGDIKLMFSLNTYLGIIPVMLGANGVYRAQLCTALPYKFYSLIGGTKLYNWKGILFAFLATVITLLLPLCISALLGIPETIIRNVKYKEYERKKAENEENGNKIKLKEIRHEIAFIPYISAGYIVFALIGYFLNFAKLGII